MNQPDIKLFKFRDDFERAGQIGLCATSIEGIRAHLGADWQELAKPVGKRETRLREARKLVKHLIRVASESTDFYRTVDFISRAAAATVEQARVRNQWKSLAGHLAPSAELTHEHMVPCEVVLRELAAAPAGVPLAGLLEPLTYRALVCKKKEIRTLDKPALRSRLPALAETGLAAAPPRQEPMPEAFKALMRYDAAGLLHELIPVSARAAHLKQAYLAWIG
ncbi:hypothetical protein [Massilia sp. X63]|uniref:hypothetical protein n=1 Tax=Massilia sp. X63 TaxID=3237285 RepID=UPI0034DD9C32